MNIYELTASLNQNAVEQGFEIRNLPQLRKQFLGKKKLPAAIFTSATIFDGANKYAFHHGGRDEMQFNVGEEIVGESKITRYGLCFSIEASRSLVDPVNDLRPFFIRLNEVIEKSPEMFQGFEIWYYQKGERHGNFAVRTIPDDWFQNESFICLGRVINKSLDEVNSQDILEILQGFDQLLPIYKFVVFGVTTQKTKSTVIFARLTSNENNWELPSSHKWRSIDQGKKNIPFENQYGFGHEEWLLNQRYVFNGFQYGYIRAILRIDPDIKEFDKIYLYTVKKEKATNLVFYVGYLANVKVISNDSVEQKYAQKLIDTYRGDMISEIENINGDLQGIVKIPFQALVKFTPDSVHFIDKPIYQPNFDLNKYKRFQPYKLVGPIEDVFDVPLDQHTNFQPGKASQTSIFNRNNKGGSVTVQKLHNRIIEALEVHLAPKYSLRNRNISIEMTKFAGNIADIVVSDPGNKITLYEVKTGMSARRNIRDAISQLLDYALHSGGLNVQKLIIVSPAKLGRFDFEFLAGLRQKINFPLEYIHYNDVGEFVGEDN